MLKNRAPYDAEVDSEVAKEYQRIQDEKRRARPDPHKELDSMRTRVSDLEGSVTRLDENMAASHKRMEDMMRMILQNQGQKHPIALDNITEPSSSTKMQDNSALTSTTVELAMLAPKQTCTPVLSAVAGADVQVVSAVHVPSDVVEDAATAAITDVPGVHTSPETIIASIIEDVLEGGKKSMESLAIDEHVEPDTSQVHVQGIEDVDEGHPETSGNAEVPEEIVSLEQVTMSKDNEYVRIMKPFSACNKLSLWQRCRSRCSL